MHFQYFYYYNLTLAYTLSFLRTITTLFQPKPQCYDFICMGIQSYEHLTFIQYCLLEMFNIENTRDTEKPLPNGRPNSSNLSQTEQMYMKYFETFWKGYTQDYISNREKDNSREMRRQRQMGRFHNQSSIDRNANQGDQSGNQTLHRLIQDVGQQVQVKKEYPQNDLSSSAFAKEKKLPMKRKIEQEVLEVRNQKQIKNVVKVQEKQQVPKQQKVKIESLQVKQTIKMPKKQDKRSIFNQSQALPQLVSTIDSSELKKQDRKSQNPVAQKQKHVQKEKDIINLTEKSSKNELVFAKNSQQRSLDIKTQAVQAKVEKPKEAQVVKQIQQENKVDEQQQEEVEQQSVPSFYQMPETSQIKSAQAESSKIANPTLLATSAAVNTSSTKNDSNDVNKSDEYLLPSQKRESSGQTLQGNVLASEYKQSSIDQSKKDQPQPDAEVKVETQQQKGDQSQPQEYIDESHFVTCLQTSGIARNEPQLQNKMSVLQDYSSSSKILQQSDDSEDQQLEKRVNQIASGFHSNLERSTLAFSEKLGKVGSEMQQLKQKYEQKVRENQQLTIERQSWRLKYEQILQKNSQLAQALQRQKKTNFDNKIKIQRLQANLKQLQEKDIFSDSLLQQNLKGQGLKRKMSQEVIHQKNETPENSQKIFEYDQRRYNSDEESQKNPSDQSDQYHQNANNFQKDITEKDRINPLQGEGQKPDYQSEKNESDLEDPDHQR